MKPPILVCGDAMVDEYWWGDVARISPEAPVPVVLVKRQEDRFGAADNVAANIQSLGGTFYSATCNVSRKIRLVARNQQVARIDFDFEPRGIEKMEKIFHDGLAACKFVVFSDYGKGALRNIQGLIRDAKASGCTVLVDPKGYDYHKYRGADLVKPNLQEMNQMVGGWGSEEQLYAKAKLLMGEAGIARVLLTRASEGMTLFSLEGVSHFPATIKEVYDVTGAGDTAIAALAVALNEGGSWGASVLMANRAAGIACGKFGTSTVSREELLNAR